MMPKMIVLLGLIAAGPWGLSTWWQMRKARSARERAFLGRSNLSFALFCLIAALLLCVLRGLQLALALPILVAVGMGVRTYQRRSLARIQAEEKDAFSRAKRVN